MDSECDLLWGVNPWASHGTRFNSYGTPPVTSPKVDMSKCSRALVRGFSRSSATHKSISLSPPSPCSLTSADLFNNSYLFPSRGLGYSVILLSRHRAAPVILYKWVGPLASNSTSATAGQVTQYTLTAFFTTLLTLPIRGRRQHAIRRIVEWKGTVRGYCTQ
jgi:hypothetical protein